MSHTLVTTKLRAPRTSPKLVARPRLHEALAGGSGRRLMLIAAPAGYGKTTLLGEWLGPPSGEGEPVAWVSLEEADNDPARFLTYLVGALQGIEEGIGEGVLPSLRSPEPPPVEAVVGALVNELAGVPEPTTIVLDDYHLIDSATVHGAVAFLLEHLPEHVRLVISTRTHPPLSLPRLRVRDQITELRTADLRFTPEEAAAFLSDVMGLTLSAEDVAALGKITEGWVAALQLAALSMRDREDVSGFVEAFSGSHRDVLDFLAEEVLDRQHEGVREFLLRTSVLDRMSAPLCDALTGRSDGQTILEKLERDNLFLFPLDDERRWYRYHHLFADFLRGRLGRESPEQLLESHRRASGWYEDNGLVAEAIGHALPASGSDPGRAARLVEQGIKEAWSRGEFPTVLRWLDALPAEAKCRRPRLFPEHALALTLTGRPDDIEPLLREAERTAEATGEDRRFLLGFSAAVRSWRARLRGDAPDAVELARRALSLLPDEELVDRNFAAVCLGDALRTKGDLALASEAFMEAIEIGQEAGHVYGTLISMVWYARVQAERGSLRDADGALRRALRFVTERRVELLPAAGLARIGMGVLLYERNGLDEAERQLAMGAELAERTREVSNLVWAYVTLSRAKRARGDVEGALETAHQAERVAHGSGADLQIAIAGSWMTRLRLAHGDLNAAERWERERAPDSENTADAAWMIHRVTSARLLQAHGRHDEALALLGEARAAAKAAGRMGDLIAILALQALVLGARNEGKRATTTLARALALAEPEGYVRTFLDEGAPMGDLLSGVLEAQQQGRAAAADRVSVSYLGTLLAALAQDRDTAAPTDPRLAEPLTERELEVLALIAAGRSNKEIARALFVETSTIKTHINNLYRKLGVRRRTQAVARARERGLL